MQTIKPEPGYVFAEVIIEEKEEKTESGILLPVSVKQHQNPIAKIVNVGDSTTKTGTSYGQGDIVLYKHYSATEVKINGADYLMIAASDILGTIKEVNDEG